MLSAYRPYSENAMNHRIPILIFASVLLISFQEACGEAGKSGLSFLKLGASARGIAMGDAMSANVSGAAATYYNPAGLLNSYADDSRTQIMLMHKEWIQDTRTEYVAISFWLGDNNALGFFLNSTTIAEIEIRTRPGTPEGTFTARNFSIGISYGHAIDENLRLGLTGKFLYEKIFIDEASGIAFDLGLQYTTPVENLSVGASLSNLGSINELRTESSKLPAFLRIGPAYSLDFESINSKLIMAADLLHSFPDNLSHMNLGGELFFNKTFAARVGFQIGSEGRGFSTGIGVHYGILALDYAYSPLSFDLGNSHTIALVLNP